MHGFVGFAFAMYMLKCCGSNILKEILSMNRKQNANISCSIILRLAIWEGICRLHLYDV